MRGVGTEEVRPRPRNILSAGTMGCLPARGLQGKWGHQSQLLPVTAETTKDPERGWQEGSMRGTILEEEEGLGPRQCSLQASRQVGCWVGVGGAWR